MIKSRAWFYVCLSQLVFEPLGNRFSFSFFQALKNAQHGEHVLFQYT
jgi:hypothetical protein